MSCVLVFGFIYSCSLLNHLPLYSLLLLYPATQLVSVLVLVCLQLCCPVYIWLRPVYSCLILSTLALPCLFLFGVFYSCTVSCLFLFVSCLFLFCPVCSYLCTSIYSWCIVLDKSLCPVYYCLCPAYNCAVLSIFVCLVNSCFLSGIFLTCTFFILSTFVSFVRWNIYGFYCLVRSDLSRQSSSLLHFFFRPFYMVTPCFVRYRFVRLGLGLGL